MLGLPLYGYVSQSTKTTLQQIARPPAGFDPVAYKEQVLGLPARGLKCPLPGVQEEVAEGEEPNALHGNHERRREAGDGGVKTEAAAGDLSAYFGQQIAFNQLVALGALTKSSSGTYGGANGYTMGEFRLERFSLSHRVRALTRLGVVAWDDCSDTPFLYNTSRKTVVTYDDTWSLGDKALFAKQNGMAGCFTWSLDQVRLRITFAAFSSD